MAAKVKVILKAFEILESLSKGDNLGLSEITALVSYPKPTVFRLLSTLEELGYIEQDEKSHTYSLSSKFTLLSRNANSGSGLIAIARPRMEILHRKFGETINLARIVDNRVVYIHILESNKPFRISDNVGDVAPYHATAIGMAILAFLPRDSRDQILRGYHFTSFTKKTIYNMQSLRAQLDEVRAAGFSVDDEGGHDGVICVGAPIFNNDHYAFAALSISMPKIRAKKSLLDDIKAQVANEAIQISLELGVTDIAKCFVD